MNPRRRSEVLYSGLLCTGKEAAMKLLDILRKGFGFLLMSMGVSSPAQKSAQTTPRPRPKD
jgi:hypothetical protein